MYKKSFAALGSLLIALGILLSQGLSIEKLARLGVALDYADAQVVDVLGKAQVMRKEGELAIAELEAKIVKQREFVATARVDAARLSEKGARLREQISLSQATLAQLADWIETGTTIHAADGSVWQPSELHILAGTQMEQHKLLQANLATYEQAHAVLVDAAERGHAQLRVAEQKVSNMVAKLDLLDANLQFAENMKALPTSSLDTGAVAALDATSSMIDGLIEEARRDALITGEINELASVDLNRLPPVGEESSDALVNELRELAGTAR